MSKEIVGLTYSQWVADTRHIANLDLCNQLYRISGWTDTGLIWSWFDPSDGGVTELNATRYGERPNRCPAYTMSYLLKRLPAPFNAYANDCAIEIRRTKRDKYRWSANIRTSDGQRHKQVADSPDDAVCMLVIDLFNKGILKNEVYK